jgi:hypothetical protein
MTMPDQHVEKSQVISAPESLTTVLGVVYHHKKASDGGDLYLTSFGLQKADLLEIENWYEKSWFRSRREELEGTSAVYRVPTKEVNGRSVELVVKNSRVGEDVPLETKTLLEFIHTEFNSPWEEFALVMEMRAGVYGPQDYTLKTQEPLAIYVPPERMQLWQSGRSRDKINRIKARHPGIELDILRQYKLVYGWIRGKNVIEALEHIGLKGEALKDNLRPITSRVIADLDHKGYIVADMKPEHIIISESDMQKIDSFGKEAGGNGGRKGIDYIHSLVERKQSSIVDYELLVRTTAHERAVRESRRHSYLFDQRDRYVATEMPPHLRTMKVFGVPYIYGHAESTGGRLWVVGKNARLFDYFLPERWRNTEGWKLSDENDVFYSHTKDHVHIVWRTSRVGEIPPADFPGRDWDRVKTLGFNSPFEEFAIADYLNLNGIQTVYSRAIYMTGSRKLSRPFDRSRYETHRDISCPDGTSVLTSDHNYITIRGYYNGPDEWVASQEGKKLCRPMNLYRALFKRVVSKEEYDVVLSTVLQELKNIRIDGSMLKPDDIILAFDPDDNIIHGKTGRPEARICNFERLYRI